MAADFSTATVAAQPAPYQHHAYKNSAHYAPLGSGANTPTNVSPTSPRSIAHLPRDPFQVPQIGDRKKAIYVPAALRRTEKPLRQSPPKVDSAVNTPDGSWGSGAASGHSAADGSSTVSRIATEDLNSIYGDVPLSPITGPITRNHWQVPLARLLPLSRAHFRRLHSSRECRVARFVTQTSSALFHLFHSDSARVVLSPQFSVLSHTDYVVQPDSSTTVCSASACQQPFGFFHRRHHCRKCGGIFCWQHSQQMVKLNEHALFHPEGEFQRACDRCDSQYREWEQMRTSRQNSESSSSNTSAVQIDTPTTPKRPEAQRVGSLATSFQGAWNWSTF
ncbi:hypothetical protein K491DRAFT_590019 [Lophiostoma macrostomum CBS 122681]|uniref:FYVE-type domain-containing protein n=1 Tax=Lophiostoma macrostomum CBS 122681 TaxID=1314788 RepID=A0A6A6TNB2_9PLEO|nr:hypothetical protein K491DRAFT_590019 [Lophiostoma macrostomum CBS 122681]